MKITTKKISRKALKNLLQRSQFTEMSLPCEIPQLDITVVVRNHFL